MPDPTPAYRSKLLAILAKLDQMESDAASILAEPPTSDIQVRADEVRELLVELQASVEGELGWV